MALAKAAPYKPYVNAPGANPNSAAAFTKAASLYYPTTSAGSTPSASPTGPLTTPPPPSGGGTSGGAGGAVDYNALLANDPFLSQTIAGAKAQGVQNLAQLNAQRQRALTGYGQIPALSSTIAGDLSGAIDPATQALAQQNTAAGTSTVAQLLRAYQQQQEATAANLAARGILRSGAYNQHATEDLGNYNIASSDAQSKLLDYLTGLYQGYLSQQQQLTGVGTQATNDAMQRIIAQIQAGTLGGGSNAGGGGGSDNSPPPPSQTAAPGQPALYVPGVIGTPGKKYAY